MVDTTQFTTKPKQDFGEQVKLNRYKVHNVIIKGSIEEKIVEICKGKG